MATTSPATTPSATPKKSAVAPPPTGIAEDAPCEKYVLVYQLPLRIWHWVTAIGLVGLFITGMLIAYPLPPTMGEASDRFVMGYIREAHYITGYVVSLAFVVRLYWVYAGNRHARQIFYLPITDRAYWKRVWREVLWYLFITKRPDQHEGHNPLARLAMFTIFLWPLVMMIFTGMALLAEGQADGHVVRTLFGWMNGLFTGMQLRFLHHVGMWALGIFTIIHLYTAVREDIMSRTSTISTMFTGKRYLKDDDAP